MVAICKKCNSNDTRNILDMMIQDWGKEHCNTIRVRDLFTKLNKDS